MSIRCWRLHIPWFWGYCSLQNRKCASSTFDKTCAEGHQPKVRGPPAPGLTSGSWNFRQAPWPVGDCSDYLFRRPPAGRSHNLRSLRAALSVPPFEYSTGHWSLWHLRTYGSLDDVGMTPVAERPEVSISDMSKFWATSHCALFGTPLTVVYVFGLCFQHVPKALPRILGCFKPEAYKLQYDVAHPTRRLPGSAESGARTRSAGPRYFSGLRSRCTVRVVSNLQESQSSPQGSRGCQGSAMVWIFWMLTPARFT